MTEEGYILIGAGLPRTGTSSTRIALKQLLHGDIYHMSAVLLERPDHHPIWKKIFKGEATANDWKSMLRDYRGGVDYPVSFCYKEIMDVFPNGKVLLNVRDPVKWYESARDSIYKMTITAAKFPCSWFLFLIGEWDSMELVRLLSNPVPSCSTMGLGMLSAIEQGEETAVKFWEEHVKEVKSHVPQEKLLVWDVKEGWGPLCKFLDVPEPSTPFPRVHDTAEVLAARRNLLVISWMVIVILPVMMGSLGYRYDLGATISGLSIAAVFLFLKMIGSIVMRIITSGKI